MISPRCTARSNITFTWAKRLLSHAGYQECEEAFRGLDYWAWQDEEGGERFYQDSRISGFCFSDERHQWPVSDCTAEALSALSSLGDHIGSEAQVEPARIVDAVRFVLSRQNADGGWGSFERRRGPLSLERLNPFEMFANCMVEHSYIECSGSCLHGLRRTLERFQQVLPPQRASPGSRSNAQGGYLASEGPAGRRELARLLGHSLHLRNAVRHHRTARQRRGSQRRGHWTGLSLADGARLADGSWGESWHGLLEGRYVPHASSQVIMTSWALMALLRAGYQGEQAQEAFTSGIQLFRERQLLNGDWPEEAVAGVFFNTAMLHYRLYKNYFPIWAPGLYENTVPERRGADQASR